MTFEGEKCGVPFRGSLAPPQEMDSCFVRGEMLCHDDWGLHEMGVLHRDCCVRLNTVHVCDHRG